MATVESDVTEGLSVGDRGAFEGKLETTIFMKIGEIRSGPCLGDKPRDFYVNVLLDQEELYRTATIEKSTNPLIGEQFNFIVPQEFSKLTFYVCDDDSVSRDPRLGHVTFTRDQLSIGHEFPKEQWYPLHAVTADSEVQGKVMVAVSVMERLDGNVTYPVLQIKVVEAAGLASWSNCGPFSDPYCTVALCDAHGVLKSESRRGVTRRKTINPIFGDIYRFKLQKYEEVNNLIIKVSLWHQQLMGDVFLGQVHLSLFNIDPHSSLSHEAWYSLCPRSEYTPTETGSIRLLLSYYQDYILPSVTYQPLLNHLLSSITEQSNFSDTALCILYEVCKDRSSMGRCIVKLFLELNKFEDLAYKLISVEVNSTSDPNTLFRGNSVASKVIDEFMKVSGQSYLHRTLQPCIDEIFEVKRSCEIDRSKLSEGENIDINMTNLLFFVEKIMSAITSSARSCPLLMRKTFSMLRGLSISKFPAQKQEVGYIAISGFIFLRFFAPAILNPKLFGLRPENPNVIVCRTLLLISKTIQNLGNIGARQRGSSLRKEDYMIPLLAELMDQQHMKAVKSYLDAVSTVSDKEDTTQSGPYREGYLVKRALARKKISVKNFKKRYFVLSDKGLSYSKSRGDAVINTIPLENMLAVERVDESAFNMKFMLQVIQPEHVLYLQAKNSVDQVEWLSVLAKSCYCTPDRVSSIHSGSFSTNWSCCGSHTVEQPGCRPISLAVKLLGGNESTNMDRELNKIYRLLLDSQDRLITLKDEASKTTRTSVENEDDKVSVLSPRLQTICELVVIIKNLELNSKSMLLQRPKRLGSKELPYYCDSSEAYLVK